MTATGTEKVRCLYDTEEEDSNIWFISGDFSNGQCQTGSRIDSHFDGTAEEFRKGVLDGSIEMDDLTPVYSSTIVNGEEIED